MKNPTYCKECGAKIESFDYYAYITYHDGYSEKTGSALSHRSIVKVKGRACPRFVPDIGPHNHYHKFDTKPVGSIPDGAEVRYLDGQFAYFLFQ